jgi:predicted dehydrogenase
VKKELSRRDLLRAGAAGSLGYGLSSGLSDSLIPAAESTSRPGEPVRLGVIGTGSRGTHLLRLALAAGVEVPALCDVNSVHLDRAIRLVAQNRDGHEPAGYSKGPDDYRRMLGRDDLQAVVVATPMQDHARMAVDAMIAGKAVLSEVAAAVTLDECWSLVKTQQQTGALYMLSENGCYWRHVMAVMNMVRGGLFGELTFAECGYVHDCRSLAFKPDGSLTWRGRLARDYWGNLYPTHSFGPVAQWLGINRGDRVVSLAAMGTRRAAMKHYINKRFPGDHAARNYRFKVTDSTTVLLKTEKGRLIDLRYDTKSARPHPSTCYHALQGTTASYESRQDGIWIEGRSKSRREWEPFSKYAPEFDDPLWTRHGEKAAGSGHGGADYFTVNAFLDAVRSGGPSPIDACDAATWSAIIPLSGKSLAEGGAPQEMPDFTGGKWEQG